MNKRIKKKIANSYRGLNRVTLNRLKTLLRRTEVENAGPIAFAPAIRQSHKFDYTEIKVITWNTSHYTSFSQFTVIPSDIGIKRNPKKKYNGNFAVYNYGTVTVINDLINNIEYTINFGDNRIMYANTDSKSVFDNAVFVYGRIEDYNDPDKLRKSLSKIINDAMEEE